MFLGREMCEFADAGFGTLVQKRSAESHVIIPGSVIHRGGVINCHGLMLVRRCAEIHRARRPALTEEANSAVAAIGDATGFQVSLTEIFTRNFNYKRLTHPTEFPSINPFRESPTDA